MTVAQTLRYTGHTTPYRAGKFSLASAGVETVSRYSNFMRLKDYFVMKEI